MSMGKLTCPFLSQLDGNICSATYFAIPGAQQRHRRRILLRVYEPDVAALSRYLCRGREKESRHSAGVAKEGSHRYGPSLLFRPSPLKCLTSRVSAKHAFLDLDCIFSAGFVYVLAVAINSAQGPAYDGIGTARSILRYLTNLGNRAAAKRLAELDQMWAHLAGTAATPDSDLIAPEVLMQTFTFERRPEHANGGGGGSNGQNAGAGSAA